MKVLDVSRFSKSYGSKEVLRDISFSIDQKDMFAILGVNGAGKTTLLECIEGLRPFHEGTVTFPHGDTFGVQLQSSTLPDNIKVGEIVELICVWNDSPDKDKYMELLDLHTIADQAYKTLSTGQKRKLHLILALINEGDILFLDEPTAGLDVEARAEFHALLRTLNEAGKTIVFSSHDMAEVESLCTRMIFLKGGEIAFFGAVEDFKKSVRKTYTVTIRTEQSDAPLVYELTDLTNELLELIQSYKDKKIPIVDLNITQPSLEDVFLKFAGEAKS